MIDFTSLHQKKYIFALNKQNPVYEEIKNIIQKTEGVVKLLKDAVEGVKGVRVAFIYGSLAKGEERQDSDIDIFFAVYDLCPAFHHHPMLAAAKMFLQA